MFSLLKFLDTLLLLVVNNTFSAINPVQTLLKNCLHERIDIGGNFHGDLTILESRKNHVY